MKKRSLKQILNGKEAHVKNWEAEIEKGKTWRNTGRRKGEQFEWLQELG
jgi:acetyl-CoA synthetase